MPWQKALLAHKIILANIVKFSIEEFSDYSIAEIMECIDRDKDGIRVCQQAVDSGNPDSTGTNTGSLNPDSKIKCSNTEDSTLDDGVIRYDILFNVTHPKSGEDVAMIINIEIQPKGVRKYNLISRAIYYVGRLISQQKNSMFEHSDYDGIRKVYSLWLCPALKGSNSYIEFALCPIKSYGPDEQVRDYYDKMRIILISFSNTDPDNQTEMVKLLNALLIDDKKLAERKKILEDEFSIPMTEISEEMDKMGSLSEAIAQQNREEGREEMRQEMQQKMQNQMLGIVRSVMNSCKISAKDAMKRMGLPDSDHDLYLKLLQQS